MRSSGDSEGDVHQYGGDEARGDGEAGGDGELGNFGRANIKSPAGAASQLLRIPDDFDQTQDQR